MKNIFIQRVRRKARLFAEMLSKVKKDRQTGFFVYNQFGHRIFIKERWHYCIDQSDPHIYSSLVYRHFRPGNGDVVVDIGAGYGLEAVYLAQFSPYARYLAIEIQPSVFECLSNTLHGLSSTYRAFPLPISNEPELAIDSAASYQSVGQGSTVVIPTISWDDFLSRFGVDRVDLLKINIEGGELPLIESIRDFSNIRRILVSCHDHRADRGDGDQFRTKAAVAGILDPIYPVRKDFALGTSWADNYIFYSQS